MVDTKDKILESAQRLIGDQGYAATSLRDIIADAGVNLAAIHYHFGSKEDLLAAVVARRAGPVNEKRLARLDQLEAEAAPGVPSVRQVLDAWFEPMADAADSDPGFVRLMGRMMSEGLLYGIVERHFRDVARRIMGALARATPHLPEEEFRWRVHFMMGAMAHAMCVMHDVAGLKQDSGDFGGRLEKLVTFLTAGFEAPASVPGGEAKK